LYAVEEEWNLAATGDSQRSKRVSFAIREFQATPNPNALKLLLDKSVCDQPLSFLNPAAAADNPLARQLFDVPGVTAVLLLGDFITINKSSEAKWPDIKRNVKHILSTA
jgi:Scaffold protein Nfu/NifU N terminal